MSGTCLFSAYLWSDSVTRAYASTPLYTSAILMGLPYRSASLDLISLSDITNLSSSHSSSIFYWSRIVSIFIVCSISDATESFSAYLVLLHRFWLSFWSIRIWIFSRSYSIFFLRMTLVLVVLLTYSYYRSFSSFPLAISAAVSAIAFSTCSLISPWP